MKQLKSEIASCEHEVLQLVATQNHLKRQQGSLQERIERLDKQVRWGCVLVGGVRWGEGSRWACGVWCCGNIGLGRPAGYIAGLGSTSTCLQDSWTLWLTSSAWAVDALGGTWRETCRHYHVKHTSCCLLQCNVKREAAESSIEQQLRDKEAIEAENAAALARITQNEALVSAGFWEFRVQAGGLVQEF